MGFFKSIFSDRKEYPELDAASPVARQLEPLRPFLEGLTREIKDSLEVIPCPHGAFVFIGKPPKKFGAVWIRDGRVTNLKDVAARKSGDEMMALVERLRAAYQHGAEAPRFKTELGGKEVVVAPSDRLGEEVEQILEQYVT